MNKRQELAWRVGGPQGSGIDTAAAIFANAVAIAGLHLHGRREYYSNIKGRHSYYDVRVAPYTLTAHRSMVDLLTSFEEETLARHTLSVAPGGGIVYDIDAADMPLDRITFLDERLAKDLRAYLEEREMPTTTLGLVEDARQRGVNLFAVRLSGIIDNLAEDLGVSPTYAQRTNNTVAVALSCALLELDRGYLVRALEKVFPGRTKVIEMNTRAIELAYEYVENEFRTDELGFRLQPREFEGQRLVLNGHRAVAMGKMAGGLAFQTYYPISPATDESVFLEAHERFPLSTGEDGAVVVVQTEDELAAITMAAGAALTGARTATATSGPGLSLMTEGLGWAAMNEVPLVITLYQRGGPSTGMPTRSEQGDLQFVLKAGHGEAPRIVVASGDAQEAFYDAAEVFNYAERYQTVVVHILDKALASTTTSIAPFDVGAIKIDRGALYDPSENENGHGPYARFAPTESGVTPRSVPGQPGGTHWLTGGEHTRFGRVTEDTVTREQMMEKRARKLELAASEIPAEDKFRIYGDPDAPLTLVSWGSNKGVLLETLQVLADEGIAARLIQIRLLSPFPTTELEPLLEAASPLVVVETNFSGQLAQLIREQTSRKYDHLVVKYNGRPIAVDEFLPTIRKIHEGDADERIVIRNPYE